MALLNSFRKLKNIVNASFLAVLSIALFMFSIFEFYNYNLNTKYFI